MFKIFRTPDSVNFLNEYEKYSQEFQKLYLESNDEDDNSVDCFYEYMKPFLSKKYLYSLFFVAEQILLTTNITHDSIGSSKRNP